MRFFRKQQNKTCYSFREVLRPVRPQLLCCLVPGVLLLLFGLLRGNRALMNALVFGVTNPFKRQLTRLWSYVPFAMAEVIWAAAVIAAVLFLLRTVWLLARRPYRLRRLLRRGLAALAAGLIVYSCYTVLWGVNYYADDFSERSGLEARGCTAGELYQLTVSFAAKCNELAESQPKDELGVTEYDVQTIFSGSAELYAGIQAEFPCLDEPLYDPKPMVFSRIISMTGFTGFYFPMTAESLVNVDQPDCLIPATILHELAHQCGVAEEDAANFVAILAGLRCDNAAFQYSSAMMGYIHLSNALYKADKSLWTEASATLGDAARTDLDDNNAYWASFESPVEEASEKVYTGFLQSYGQSEGMKSYGQCVDLLVAYYFD